MSYQDLPMCCRTCANRQSQYLYPSWTHRCTRAKPMVENCQWKQPRHPNLEIENNERKDH